MDHNLLFKHFVRKIQVCDLAFDLCFIDDLDEALDYYIKTAPTDADKIPYFTNLWESGQVLAEYLAAHKEIIAGREILEMGCGLGLPSLCAAKIGARVTATDFHPDCRAFFLKNAALNHLEQIQYDEMDWRQPHFARASFDIVMGSDLIYEKAVVPYMVQCADYLLKPGGLLLYADPGRSALQNMTTGFEKLGMTWELKAVGDIYLMIFTKKGEILHD